MFIDQNFNRNVVIVSAVRTPIGSFNCGLKSKSASDLGSIVIKEAYKRANLEPNDINEVIMGHVLQAQCKQAPARQAAINAGLSVHTECTSINKICASGLKSIIYGCQSILLGDQEIVISGGMESMSQAPFLVPRTIPKYGGQYMADSILCDGLTCAINGIHMGSCTERLAKKFGITRSDQDNFAIDSYQRSNHAMNSNIYKDEIVPCIIEDKNGPITISKDEEPLKFLPEKMLKLKPVFEKDGTITAANASKLGDGAAAVVLMSLETAKQKNIKPLAQIIAYADAAIDPIDFGLAPSYAIRKVLSKANMTKNDIHYWEINEAFSAVSLANIKELKLDANKVNIDGGAVSMGHPLGMSGTRIVVHLAHRLKMEQFGLAAVCNGGGGSSAIIIKKL